MVCVSPAFAQEKTPEELLTNPGFEDVTEGNIAYWQTTSFAATSSTERVDKGARSLKISSDKIDFSPMAHQEVHNVEQGKNYKLEYRVRAAQFNQEYRVYVGVWKKNPEGNQWLRGIDDGWRVGWDNWQKVSVEFTLNDPADFMMVVIQGKGPCDIWFDDVSLKLSDKQKAPEKEIKPLAPFVGSSKFVQIMPDKTFRVAGKPFFPIILWGWEPNTEEAMAKAQDSGFNVVTPTHIDALGPDAFKLWLDKAHKYGLLVKPTAYFGFSDEAAERLLPLKLTAMKRTVQVGTNHPAMFGYTVADEPAWGGFNMEAYAAGAHLLRDTDPNHPIIVNHAPRNTIAELRRYNRFTDISGSDIYPVWKTGVDIHSDLPNKTIGVVGDETTKNFEGVDFAKPIIQTLQGFAWSDNSLDPNVKDEPFPSQDQLRFMTYHTIVRGATGVAFFQDGRYRTVKPELKPIAREINTMSNVLAAGKTLDSKTVTTAAGIELLAKELNGQLVLIALNSSPKAVDARLDLSSLLKGNPVSLTVMQENRKVSVSGKSFTDSFAPFAVHIYATDEKKVLRPFVVAKVKAEPVKQAAKVDTKAEAPKRENLALNAKANGSSVYATYNYSAINDGKPDVSWNDATHYTYPDWLTLEFPQPVTIDQIVVYSHQMMMFDTPVTNGIRDYELHAEIDGKWETIATVKDSTTFREVVDLKKPITTNKLRVWITATNGDQDWSRLGEVEVYGKVQAN